MNKLVLLLSIACACNPWREKAEPTALKDSSLPVTDTIIPPTPVNPTDHASLIQYLHRTLKHQRFGKAEQDTIFGDYSGKIMYEVGHLFSANRVHAVVSVQDAGENPVYVFKRQQNNWVLIHQLREVYNPTMYPIELRDINFDGYKDLLIRWYYMAGRCNCWGDGCLNVYLYNPLSNSLVENKEIPGYLDVHIIESERAIYLGNHCDHVYRKFRWNKMEMLLAESYEFSPSECWESDTSACVLVHRVHNNGMIKEDTLHEAELPDKWYKIFHDD